jgi:hypothetical protein
VPFEPVPLSDIVIVPTLLPWASFIWTTVLAALASDQKIIAHVTAAMKNRLSFMAPDYNQAAGYAPFPRHMRQARFVILAWRSHETTGTSQVFHFPLQFLRNPLGITSRLELQWRADPYSHLTWARKFLSCLLQLEQAINTDRHDRNLQIVG